MKIMTKPTVDVPGAKRMIASLAAAATIGLWAIFARIERNASAGASEPPAEDIPAPPVEMQPEGLVKLPPLPTLVPALAPGQLSGSGSPQPAIAPVLAPVPGGAVPTPPRTLVWKSEKERLNGGGGKGDKAKPDKPPKEPKGGSGSSK
jgi:hypothetical protein